MKSTDANETILVIRAQTGDLLAFEELLRRVQAPLWRYILNMVGDRHLSENVLQDVFLISYRKIGWLNDPAVFRPWMYRIASRECFRQMKKEKQWQRQVRDDEVLANLTSDEVPLADAELLSELPRLLAEVSPASRAVLSLHYLEELTLSEIAEILDISTGTVKSRLAYGLTKLREQLPRRSAQ